MVVRRLPAPELRRAITAYHGFESDEPPTRRREGPGAAVVLLLTFEHEWRIDGEPRESFVAGLRTTCVETESRGGMHSIQIDLVPWAARALFRVPLHELAGTSVPLEELVRVDLVAEVGAERSWESRFTEVDRHLALLLADAQPPDAGVAFAWDRLRATDGTARIGALAGELGW